MSPLFRYHRGRAKRVLKLSGTRFLDGSHKACKAAYANSHTDPDMINAKYTKKGVLKATRRIKRDEEVCS